LHEKFEDIFDEKSLKLDEREQPKDQMTGQNNFENILKNKESY